MSVYSCIRNIIKYCVSGQSANDSGKYSIQQASNGNVKDMVVLYPYGMHANAPVNSFGISFNIQGKEENPACMMTSTVQRTKNLKAGEVEFGNLSIGARTFYDESGNIVTTAIATYTINGSSHTINCNTSISGNLIVSGNINATNITSSGAMSAGNGATGSFTSADGPPKTVTVTNGIITSIV